MTFKVTFVNDTEKTYVGSVTCSIDDMGALTITDGEDSRTYTIREWESVAPVRRRAL